MKHRLPSAALAAALLLLTAATAWGETTEGRVRREAPRERPAREASPRGEGFRGLTLIRLHTGFSSPIGDFSNGFRAGSDGFDTGWGAGVGVAYGVSRDVLISTDLAYHHFEEKVVSGRMAVVPWTMNVEYVIPTTGRVHPWVSGGLGIYHLDWSRDLLTDGFPPIVRASATETDAGMSVGMGVGGPLSPRTDWGVGVKLHQVFEGDGFPGSDFFTFQIGIAFRP